jgi:hypothetical protein
MRPANGDSTPLNAPITSRWSSNAQQEAMPFNAGSSKAGSSKAGSSKAGASWRPADRESSCSAPPSATAAAATPMSSMPWPQPSRPPTKPAGRPPTWPPPELQ